MGCYPPLVKFVSRAIRKCNGRERWREERLDYAMAYPPGPPMETRYMRPVARTVTFAGSNDVYVIPPQKPPPTPPPQQEQSTPEPPHQPQTPPQHEPDHHDTAPQPQAQPEPPASEQQEKAPDPPAPPAAEPKPPKAPKRGKNKKPGGRVRFGPDQAPPPPQEQHQHAPEEGHQEGGQLHGNSSRHGPQAGPVPAYLFRYTPSPLPRWEATPRRHEYFSGEYRSYYPTPVREGIYRIATDANRLTTIFSEENPNACAIV